MQKPSLQEINSANRDVIDQVTDAIIKENDSDNVRFDGGSNGARFENVPKYAKLVADKHHKILHLKSLL